MKRRQILAVMLAAALSVSATAVGANAAADTIDTAVNTDITAGGSFELNVDSDVKQPTLDVSLPTSAAVMVNPYRIEITTESGDKSFDTVLSPEMEVTNKSGCAITVGVKGMLQTYTIVDITGMTAVGSDINDATKFNAPSNKSTIANSDLENILMSADGKTFADAQGRQITATYKAPILNDDTTVKTKGTFTVTGYTASKDIKVATAPMKDVDADKSNTIFMFVEGKADDAVWSAGYDAAKAKTPASATNASSMMALTAKETSQKVLYVAGGDTTNGVKGQLRISGQASTAPTKAWTEIKDKFDTKVTFVIDPVANKAPEAPKATDIKIDGTSITGFAADTLTYNLTATTADGPWTIAVNVPAGATSTITASGELSKNAAGKIVFSGTAGTGAIAIDVTQYGLTTTYTINVTIS